MKIWIGHYKGNSKEWFVVWAKNEHEAFLQIDPIMAEPDMESLKELHAPGFINFSVKRVHEPRGEFIDFTPIKGEMFFGGALGQSDNVQEYILQMLSRKRKKK